MQLDNAIFLDWFASLAGIYRRSEAEAIYRLELDRGAVLRVTNYFNPTPVALTVLELLQRSGYHSPLTLARRRPAVSLTKLRRRGRARRLALEATLQRSRLYPFWLKWMTAHSPGQYDFRDNDRYILRFLPEASFDDLVVVAKHVPRVGPGLTWALFRADACNAAMLFEEWIAFGQHERFRDLAEQLPMLAADYVATPFHETFVRVAAVVAEQADVGKAEG